MSREQQSESIPHAPPKPAPSAPENPIAADRSNRSAAQRSKLPFFRMILWIAVYSAAVLFLMSLVLLGLSHVQTKIIGGAWIAAVALMIATYVPQWRR